MHEKPGVGVGVVVIVDGKVLLIKRRNVHGAGTWSTPGGHIDFGETPEDCAVREVKEETGVDITGAEFVGVTNDVFESERKHYLTVWFEAKHAAGEASVSAPEEMSELGWFEWSSLPSPLFLPLANLLNGNCYPRGSEGRWK